MANNGDRQKEQPVKAQQGILVGRAGGKLVLTLVKQDAGTSMQIAIKLRLSEVANLIDQMGRTSKKIMDEAPILVAKNMPKSRPS